MSNDFLQLLPLIMNAMGGNKGGMNMGDIFSMIGGNTSNSSDSTAKTGFGGGNNNQMATLMPIIMSMMASNKGSNSNGTSKNKSPNETETAKDNPLNGMLSETLMQFLKNNQTKN